jgi:hypothetical protein
VAHPADSVPRPAAATAEAPPAEQGRARVAAAVRAAAAASGFDPEMLLAIAMAESSLREGARNPRSTAAGPLQFTTPTWLAAVHAYADRIPALAPHRRRMMELASRDIALGGSALPPRQRRPVLAALRREQAAARGAALALRHDAAVAARVAAVLAQDDADRFRALTGARPAGPGEIYAIHLLGVGVAADLARAERQRPAASVEGVLPPGVLRANREIFRGEGGRALTVREAQARIAARLRPPETTELVQLAEAP